MSKKLSRADDMSVGGPRHASVWAQKICPCGHMKFVRVGNEYLVRVCTNNLPVGQKKSPGGGVG